MVGMGKPVAQEIKPGEWEGGQSDGGKVDI